jgi:hypothetical protein
MARADRPEMTYPLLAMRHVIGNAIWRQRRLGLCALVLASGCGLFGNGSTTDGGTSTGDTNRNGFGVPTLELTINGVRFGPSAPAAGSVASVTSQRDASGVLQQTTFVVSAASSVSGASCSMSLVRFGNGIAGFRGGGAAYRVMSASASATPDGTVAPQGGESVSVPQGTWSCNGSDCDGGVLLLTTLAADHIEGAVSGTYLNPLSGTDADVVCSFYLPTGAYDP